jgi:pimeloyl-ACP methyl ester carboxylesterase
MADPVILVHGAWQGSWAWEAFLPHLAKAGIRAIAVDLPGNGVDGTPAEAVTIDLYVDHVGTLIDKLGDRVSLVGHSGGGVVATAVAERFPDRVSRIAYIAGMMLPAGMGFGDLQQELAEPGAPPSGISGHLIWSDDRLTNWARRDKALEIFYHDCDPAEAERAVDRLTPQPFGGFALIAHPTPDGFGRIPRLYVEATQDRSVTIGMQRRMQQLVPGAEVVSLETGHVPQLSAPEKLSEALVPFLTRP